jgi:4-hydroxy-4-methyl-2-oxoglutarate aldolase
MTSDPTDLAEAIRLLLDVETATIGHFLDDGFMPPAIQCLRDRVRICGPAFTVALPGNDGTALALALSRAKAGDVLVVERGSDDRHACWGAVMSAAAEAAGLAGIVIDGFVTDLGAVRDKGPPVWCKGRSPLTTKLRGGGTFGGAVCCGGVSVEPGDVILADENGVLVLNPSSAVAIARKALAIQADEPGIVARLLAGDKLDAVYNLLADDREGHSAKTSRPEHAHINKEVIEVPIISAAIHRLGAPTSAIVRTDDFIFTCGMPPIDCTTGEIVTGAIEVQTRASLNALKTALEHAGSSLANVVKVTIYVSDPAMMSGVNAVYREFFAGEWPARTSAAIRPWSLPFDIEIECVAVAG